MECYQLHTFKEKMQTSYLTLGSWTKDCISNTQSSRFALAAQLSAIAYCPLNLISSWSCYYCREHPAVESVVAFNDSTVGVQGFVAVLSQAIVISFRGTANYLNRRNVVKFFKTNAFPQLSLVESPVTHKGFSSSYDSVKYIVQELVLSNSIKYPFHDIYFTGHSLGTLMVLISRWCHCYISSTRCCGAEWLFIVHKKAFANSSLHNGYFMIFLI